MNEGRANAGDQEPMDEGSEKPNSTARRMPFWLVPLVPLIGPAVALIAPGRLATPAAASCVRRGAVLALAIHVVVLVTAFGALRYWVLTRQETVKRYAHELQLAVERWTTDVEIEYRGEESSVPATLGELVDHGYLASLPINPYTGQPIRCIAWGDPPSAGDVSYLPVYTAGDAVPFGAYVIIAYGPRGYAGKDLDEDGRSDQVLICLWWGWSHRVGSRLPSGGPPVSDVLRMYRGQAVEGWTTVPPPNRVIPTWLGK